MVIPHEATFGTLVLVGELYVAIALVFGVTTRLFGNAGRTFGVDRLLHEKLPRVPIW